MSFSDLVSGCADVFQFLGNLYLSIPLEFRVIASAAFGFFILLCVLKFFTS